MEQGWWKSKTSNGGTVEQRMWDSRSSDGGTVKHLMVAQWNISWWNSGTENVGQ